MQISIRDRRTELDLTQEQCASACGVSIYAFQKWERGQATPTPENLQKLLKCLQIG